MSDPTPETFQAKAVDLTKNVEEANVIEVRNVTKSYKNNGQVETVIENMNLVIPNEQAGEFTAILGPSGSGKSTLMNMIGGTLAPTSGEVFAFGKKIEGDNPFAVTVQQAYTCLPWLTVQRNVEFGLEIRGMDKASRRQVASDYIEKVGLGDRANALPKELSGGMQQRVAIARCLALKPKIMLMDEPFGALDAKIREDMQGLLLKLWDQEKNCVIFITHDITEALLLADRIIVVSSRPAKIIEDMRVPFARPRMGPHAPVEDLAMTPEFLRVSQSLLKMLKEQGSGGQVRVSL
ncbi:MAG TPA: ABC transporter ATP-binding protein [Fimbriimonadaceae bacterium]|nr:ABC transporter ATP-binding protein [Fimbriimonadaceae bacterium]